LIEFIRIFCLSAAFQLNILLSKCPGSCSTKWCRKTESWFSRTEHSFVFLWYAGWALNRVLITIQYSLPADIKTRQD